ncbi:hypothetical protein P3342_002989 [Pyrenophora teres f. teres]|nr:hypothetical protein P3342_002989 [Pyrenophora teres f. teres]
MSNEHNSQHEVEPSDFDMSAFFEDAYFENTGIDMSESPTDMGVGQPGGIQGGDWAPPPTSQGPQYRAAGAGAGGPALSFSQILSQGTEVLPAPATSQAAPAIASKKAGKPRATRAKEPKKITAKVTKPKKTSTKVTKPKKKATKVMERTIAELFNLRWSDLKMVEKHKLLLPLLSGIDPNTGAKIGTAGALLPPPDFEAIGKDLFNTGIANIFTAGSDASEEKARINSIARRIEAGNKKKMTPERITATSSSPAANVVTISPYQTNIVGNNNVIDLTAEDTSFINGGFQNIDSSRNTNELTAQTSTSPDFSDAFSNFETLNNNTSLGTVNTNSFNGSNFGSFSLNPEDFDLNAGSFNMDDFLGTNNFTNSFSSDVFGTEGFIPLDTNNLSSDSFTAPDTNNFANSFSSDVFGTEGFTPLDTNNLSSDSFTAPDTNNLSSDSFTASDTNNFSSDSFKPLDINDLSSDIFNIDNPDGVFGGGPDSDPDARFDAIMKSRSMTKTSPPKTTTGTHGRYMTKFGETDFSTHPSSNEEGFNLDLDQPTRTKGFHGNLGGPCGNGIIGPNGVITVPPQVPTNPSAYGAARQQEALERNAMLRAQGRRR